jgi:uroporphyrinogen decarboxylase
MTLRERVVAALNGEAVFPVPTDVYENGVHRDLGKRLAQRFGFSEQDVESLLTTFSSSIRWARPMYIGPELEEDKSGMHVPVYPATKIFRDFWGTWGESAATYYDGLPRPLRDAQTVADVDAHPWPDPDWFDYGRVGWFSTPPEGHLPIAEWSARNRDYAHLAGGWSPIFSRTMDMFGMETGLMHVVERPDLIEATITHIADFLEEYYRRFAREARGHCEILAWGDDVASQRKPADAYAQSGAVAQMVPANLDAPVRHRSRERYEVGVPFLRRSAAAYWRSDRLRPRHSGERSDHLGGDGSR